MSGVKRTRPVDDNPSTQSQTTATTITDKGSPKAEPKSPFVSTIEEEYNCPICFELISEAYVSRCGHSFCSKCLQRTVESHRRCPKCQLSLQPADIFPNYTCKEIHLIQCI